MLAAVYAAFPLFQIPLIEMSVDAQYNACPGKSIKTGVMQ